MYCQSFFTTSVRGIAFFPTTAARAALGVNGFMKAALGLRADFFFAVAMILFLKINELIIYIDKSRNFINGKSNYYKKILTISLYGY